MPLRNLLIISFCAVLSIACYEKAQKNRYATILAEAMYLISDHYIEDVEPKTLFEAAMGGMVAELDPYSAFFTTESLQNIEETLDQQFGGVGIVVELNAETNRLTVMSPLVGTPAHQAGLRAGDTILRINETSTEGMLLEEAVKLMRGAPGTPVEVAIRRPGEEEELSFTLERAIIPVRSVLGDTRNPDGTWNYFLEENPRIGYLRVTTFGKQTVEEVTDVLKEQAVRQGSQFDALILDLRNNAGGLLDSAVATCDLFIDSGRIVSTRGRGGEVKSTYNASSEIMYPKDAPMVVLTNRYSASAAEIVAACLQDRGRAVVAGERTWGKGTVQNIIELESGDSALKLTTASYWRPSEKNIHREEGADEKSDWGVRPNKGMEVTLTDKEFEKMAEYRRQRDYGRDLPLDANEVAFVDPQLERAIVYLENKLSERGQMAGRR